MNSPKTPKTAVGIRTDLERRQVNELGING